MGRRCLVERMRSGRRDVPSIVRRAGVSLTLLAGAAASAGFVLAPARPQASARTSAAALLPLDGAAPLASPNSLAGVRLWVDASSDASRQAGAWRGSRPADAALMEAMASQPSAQWLGEWVSDPRSAVAATMSRAARGGSA